MSEAIFFDSVGKQYRLGLVGTGSLQHDLNRWWQTAILSHITAPTTGHISYRGRIASLLEVGTGFHPEMTARQNIYMNGSIMGMTRHEITQKLDEIVDFAGIERYLDTPVKRFSFGITI